MGWGLGSGGLCFALRYALGHQINLSKRIGTQEKVERDGEDKQAERFENSLYRINRGCEGSQGELVEETRTMVRQVYEAPGQKKCALRD